MGRAIGSAAALLLFTAVLAYGQASSGTTGTSSAASAATGSPSGTTPAGGAAGSASGTTSGAAAAAPVPYSDSEFPLWARDLRRAEAITIGAFPFTLLVSSLSYQLYRYAANQFDSKYSPGLFGSATTPLAQTEQIGVFAGGVGLAVAVALVDFVLGLVEAPAQSSGTAAP